MSNPHPALAPVFKRFENFDLSVGSRDEFYETRRLFIEAARGQGFARTVQDAADLIEEAVSPEFWTEARDRHSDTFAALHQIASIEPRTFIDEAFSCWSGVETFAAVPPSPNPVAGITRATRCRRGVSMLTVVSRRSMGNLGSMAR